MNTTTTKIVTLREKKTGKIGIYEIPSYYNRDIQIKNNEGGWDEYTILLE